MCLYPKLILNKKYTSNKKNGGIIPAIVDERTRYVSIGCQRCMECRKKRARDWMIRLNEEVKRHKNGKFVTLTFSDQHITELAKLSKLEGYAKDNEIATIAVRRFLERWRKKYKTSLRHWLITELGQNGTENIHLHGIIWTNESIETIEKYWQYGFMHKDFKKHNYVNGATVGYCVKYVSKQDEKHKGYISKILTTPGIGKGYETSYNANNNKYQNNQTNETYRTDKGHKIALPIYYRNKIYSEEEREQLWLQKLDKNELWICGEKIPATDQKQQMELLKYYRKINKQLGYGDDEKTWEQEQYERQRREILYETRKQRACGMANKASATATAKITKKI